MSLILILLLIYIHVAAPVFGQGTTLPAAVCETPSCTVSPTPISSVKIQPSPVTVNPPGASLPVVLTFEAITLSNLELDPTVLHNPGSGTLTLGKTTISNIKATATTSYLVAPSETLKVAAIADVREEIQLSFGFDSNELSICRLTQDSSILRSRVARRLRKRGVNFLQFGNDNFGISSVLDAATVIDRVIDRMTEVADPTQIFDLGSVLIPFINFVRILAKHNTSLNAFFDRQDFGRLLSMAQSIRSVLLDEAGSPEVTFTTFSTRLAIRDVFCGGGDIYGRTLGGSGGHVLQQCQTDAFTVFCPLAETSYMGLPTQANFCNANNGVNTPASGFLSFETLLDMNKYDFGRLPGSGGNSRSNIIQVVANQDIAALVLHELTHYRSVCQSAGFPPLAVPIDNDIRDA
jgi:hypothetical protein